VFTLRAFEEEEEEEGGNAGNTRHARYWLATTLPEVIGAAVRYWSNYWSCESFQGWRRSAIWRTAKLRPRALNSRPCSNNLIEIFREIQLYIII